MVLAHMEEMPNDQDELFARAKAAIAEARRLTEENREWQKGLTARMNKMCFRTTFFPKSVKLFSPQDFPDRRPPYQHFRKEDDDNR